MEAHTNPYAPGAGTPPPILAGRDEILRKADETIRKCMLGNATRSMILLGLRGVGKTVLLNRIEQIAEDARCEAANFEASANSPLPDLVTPQLVSSCV